MAKLHVSTTINGEPMEFLCEPNDTMLDALRGPLALTGSKEGCASGDCGACSITLDDRLVCSCLMLAAEAEGCEISTIEGMAHGEKLHPLQQKFLEMAALQCGICTSGMLVASEASGSPAISVGAPVTTKLSARFLRPQLRYVRQHNEHHHQQQVDRPAHHSPRRRRQGHRTRGLCRRHHHARHDLGQGQAQPASARPHQIDRHLESRGAARRESGGHRARRRRFPDRQVGHARHPGHALDVPQRDGAREGAVPRPPRRGGRRHHGGHCGKSLRIDRGRL